ncbi:MAG: copper chaperone PCu(A)C [Burkholderiaceae bacterium]
MKSSLKALLALAALVFSGAANAQVEASNVWARATVQGQMGSGAFMTLTAKEPVRLVGAASPVAGVVEIHEMAMQGNVMRMRAVEGLDLAAGKPVELKPGGHHVMLMDLKRTLKAGERIPVELRFETKDKRQFTLPLEAEVRMVAPGAAMPMKH